MASLSKNWVVEGTIDFEYKKYVLLGYLQAVQKHFNDQKVYPFLSDLILHHQSLLQLHEQQSKLQSHFPKKLKQVDLEKFTLVYESLMHEHSHMIEIRNILDYAIPRIEKSMKEGSEIYESIEHKLSFETIGVIPLHTDSGYLLIRNGDQSDTVVYDYHLSIIEQANARFRAIRTKYIDTYAKRFSNTCANIKLDLISRRPDLPNPATFMISSPENYPIAETLLPIAKRSLVRFLSVKK